MAEMLDVSCRDCGMEEVQSDGPLMSGYQPRCEQCGDTRLVSPRAPADRGDGQHPTDGALDAFIAREAGTCWCGGQFAVDAPIRCSVCRSRNVSTTSIGVAD